MQYYGTIVDFPYLTFCEQNRMLIAFGAVRTIQVDCMWRIRVASIYISTPSRYASPMGRLFLFDCCFYAAAVDVCCSMHCHGACQSKQTNTKLCSIQVLSTCERWLAFNRNVCIECSENRLNRYFSFLFKSLIGSKWHFCSKSPPFIKSKSTLYHFICLVAFFGNSQFFHPVKGVPISSNTFSVVGNSRDPGLLLWLHPKMIHTITWVKKSYTHSTLASSFNRDLEWKTRFRQNAKERVRSYPVEE